MYTNCNRTIFIASFKTKNNSNHGEPKSLIHECKLTCKLNTYHSGAVPYQRLENIKRTEMAI